MIKKASPMVLLRSASVMQWAAQKRSLTVALCALTAILIGTTVLVGWAIRNPTPIQIFPDLIGMVIGTALCLVLGGVALLLPYRLANRGLRRACGAVVLILASLMLSETLFNVNLGIDWPSAHRWLSDPNLHPGRMAPNTALAFMLIGLMLMLMDSERAQRHVLWRKGLPLLVMVIALSGVLGYFLKIDFLYNWHGMAHMALHTAAGITALGAGLWLKIRNEVDSAQPRQDQGHVLITTVGVAFVLIATIASFGSFAMLQDRIEDITAADLLRQHVDRSQFIAALIEHRAVRAETISTLATAQTLLRQLKSVPGEPRSRAMLTAIATSYLAHGFTWIAFYQHGRVITSAGAAVAQPKLDVLLQGQQERELLWDQGYYLRTRLPVYDGEDVVGEIIAEQPLDILARLAENDSSWGQTGEMVLCNLNSNPFECFPERFHRDPFTILYRNENRADPMTHALDGKRGTITTLDFRKERVLAAYGPIDGYGLGMVLKMDWAELYSPVREQLHILLAALALLVALSLWLVWQRVRPLVNQLVQARQEAQANEARFVAAAENNPDAFSILESVRDEHGKIYDFRFRYLNDNAAAMMRLPRAAIIGRLLCVVLPRTRSNGFFEKYRHVVETGEPLIEEISMSAPEASDWWLNQQAVKLGDGVAITARNITARKLEEERLTYLAQTDALTGAANRVLFLDRLQHAMARARRNNENMALLYLDIDHFKEINDTFGHLAGDEVLRTLTDRMRCCLRPSDTIARIAGDEFTVILEGVRNPSDVKIVAGKMQEAFETPAKFNGTSIPLHASIGIALYHDRFGEAMTADDLIAHADAALYAAKHRGRNTYAIFEAELEKNPAA